ncbi:hypothetical protein SCH01S_33_00300 [Sphingomonas changbaiensis NBRC 104936]|uniref:Uncharacterized protein n=1 Tax=Sphingomonas changbaiensis NBRC 104936 TaxID=1219043 RepID=A0A0E9MPX3_9SPHN|nr:hypothetical protein SCH01S_33_00300 [Sphingomonas changbaiensis NBRC 104936]
MGSVRLRIAYVRNLPEPDILTEDPRRCPRRPNGAHLRHKTVIPECLEAVVRHFRRGPTESITKGGFQPVGAAPGSSASDMKFAKYADNAHSYLTPESRLFR